MTRIVSVDAGSPAYDAGFEAGCEITSVDGNPVRDIIDWRWLSAGDEIELGYVDNDGDAGFVVLEREPGEGWGFVFDGLVFDGMRTCRNSCTFCFMRQLPKGMRKTLSTRDDDFRMSFLSGTFVTLTNLSDADVDRIAEQRISPLRVSLHAVDADVRRRLIGKNAQAGIDNLLALLGAGVEFDAQIVLVPDVNDGDQLDLTLKWAYDHPGIKTVGIVPLGFTRFQEDFDHSFDEPEDALRVVRQVEPFQRRALAERGTPWVYAADEFYRNAFGAQMLDALPDASFYGDFSMFEDGIGIIRSVVDDFAQAVDAGLARECALALEEAGACAVYICGEAMLPHIDQLIAESDLSGRLRTLPVKNEFFGGNVNVTGLLTGRDIANAIGAFVGKPAAGLGEPTGGCAPAAQIDGAAQTDDAARADGVETPIFLIPEVVFNADGLTLDDMTLDDIKTQLPNDVACRTRSVATNPLDYMGQIVEIAKET